jgi:hypothetical protein
MKVTGETFSFIKRKTRSRRGKIQKVSKLLRQKDCYRTELWKVLYKKTPTGQFLIFRKTLTEFANKELFPNFLGRIFQVERQSKKVMPLFFYSVFFVYKSSIKYNKR